MSEQQNNYSENNYKTFGAFAGIMGTFLIVFKSYVNVFPTCKCDNRYSSPTLTLLTGTMYLILLLLSVLSIVLGYERRRDQIVSSSHIQGSLDVQLYGDGKNKKWFNYMPNLYIVFLCFFIICILSFTFFTLTSQMLFYHLPLYACIIDLGIISFVYFELWKKIKKLSNKK